MNNIQFLPLTLSSPYYSKAKHLYKEVFSKEEQFPFWLLTLLSYRKSVNFWVIVDTDIFVGIVYIIHDQQVSYIFYLATVPHLHSNGYGSMILQKIKTLYPNQELFLTIEEVSPKFKNYTQRIRRKKFYQRNGYYPQPYFMLHKDHRFQVLSLQEGNFDSKKLTNLFLHYSFGLANVKFMSESHKI